MSPEGNPYNNCKSVLHGAQRSALDNVHFSWSLAAVDSRIAMVFIPAVGGREGRRKTLPLLLHVLGDWTQAEVRNSHDADLEDKL